MNPRRTVSIATNLSVRTCVLGVLIGFAVATAQAQQPADQAAGATTTIRAESRLVLVDAVVTDKKGNYLQDLTEKDFKVWEDDQEQKINTFSFEQTAVASSQKRYLVLFFDNDAMKPSDQAGARAAAGKFLDTNSGPGRFVAVIDYVGTMRVAQNFTDDVARLKQVVGTAKLSITGTEMASTGSPVFANYDSFSNRNVLLALRSVARSLASVPGRKSLIWLTSGFPLDQDTEAEMTALINVCNKSNVAVYPVDVRGLSSGVSSGSNLPPTPAPNQDLEATVDSPYSGEGEYAAGTPRLVYVAQTKPGGGGGTGGTRPGGTTGNTGRVVTPPPPRMQPPSWSTYPGNQPRTIVPPFPQSTAVNQQVLYSVAIGTGGFVIVNSNDLLTGLEKIGKEQTEYYILGYVPPEGPEGACHTLRVKVDRSGAQVRARSGYCATKPVDYLAGKPVSKELESRAMGSQSSDITGSLSVPYFYTAPGTARINLALEVPGKAIKFEKVKGKYHAVLNILGMATKPDGSVAARFSDAVELDFEKKDLDDFASHPYHYENQFYISSGQYTLKLVVNSGDKYGKFEAPLTIDRYDNKTFGMSDLALSKQFYKVSELSSALDAQLLQDRTPLITQGLQLVPSGSNRFKPSERVAIYLEVYEPQIADAKPPKVGLELRITNQKTGKQELEAGVPDTQASVTPGNPVIPMGVPLPVDQLQPGDYVVELRAVDSAGHSSAARKAEFSIE